MNKKLIACLILGTLIVGGVTGLGVYNVQTAQAANGAGQVAGVTAAVTQEDTSKQDQQEAQNPSYIASIRVPNPQDTHETAEENSQDNEAAESSSLRLLAKISPEQASASALQAVPGKVIKVSLDNENGNLVYSVEIKTLTGVVDVKVDAGNGKVLSQDSGEDDEAREIDGSETEGEKTIVSPK
ncbi:MAG TPA: peptidase [Firmicutes bacterium]|nr:peptidase [Candidatus Fermentithermobacillaceae bacterium]